MEWMKLLGCTAVLLCGALLGLLCNRRLSEELGQADAWSELLRFTKLQVACFSLPMGQILQRADRELLCRCGWRGEHPPKDFRTLAEGCALRQSDCRALLLAFADGFGRGYREEQLRECEYYIDQLGAWSDGLRARLGGRKKVNATLCVSGALALVILFV